MATTLVWGFIAMSTLVDPNFYQRCFAAESPKVAKKGILVSTIIWILFDLCTTFGAMYAKAVISEADSSTAYLTYSIQLLPPGLKGFFLAGILATILSTLDSYLFLAGATLSHDLAPEKYKNKSFLHPLGVLFTGAMAILMANYFKGDIKSVWKTLGSYSAACLLIPVILGHLLKRKISDNQFIITCLFGVITTTIWRHASKSGFWNNVDELYIGSITTLTIYLFFYSQRRRLNNDKR